jgi:hypothetical protein
MLPRNVLLYGRDEPLPESVPLRAGPLKLLYEEGDLRYIRLGDREIVRRIYVAVRDRNWDTVAPEISEVRIERQTDSFRISYAVRNRQGEIDFAWTGTITGGADGTIRFAMDGEARSTFARNRIGFCVLHPFRECPGQPCRVEHADGSVEEGAFPRFISPHQPFKEIRAISHEVVPGLRAEVRFEGDIFEMEDHRNWTDASLKTYCTPLALPYPVEVRQGTRIAQSVTLTLSSSAPPQPSAGEDAAVRLAFRNTPPVGLPRIGLGVASHGQPLSAKEVERLRMLRLGHLRLDLRLSGPAHAAALRRATEEARALGVPLQVAVILSNTAEAELDRLLGLLEEVRPPVVEWLVFHQGEMSTSERWVRLARERLGRYDPASKVGAGTNAFFTELNRGRPPINALDLACYSINPQAHAFDNAALVENLEAQAATVESARQFLGDLPLAVGPVTLKARFNPSATGPERELGPDELPAPVDVRQMSLFGAAWTLGSLKYLAESGAESVTYYETTGWRGVMETGSGSPKPELFRSLPGTVFPLFHVLADVGEFMGGEVLPLSTSDPLRANALALRKDGRARVLVANMTSQAQNVSVEGITRRVQMRRLDETNAEEAIREPEGFRARPGEQLSPGVHGIEIELPAYAVVRLDTTAE